MAGSKSDYLENLILDHVLGGGDFTRPASVHVALYSATPSDAGGGTEFSGDGYARVEVVNNTTNWPNASDNSNQKQNGVDIEFASATGNWGTASAFGIFDDLTTGNLLYWGDLSLSKLIETGDTPKFPAGCIVITED